MAKIVGRRVGSKVKLTAFGKRLYPQWKDAVGKITKREILTVGHGLAWGQRARYVVSYRVRWGNEKRDYLMSSENLQSVRR